MNNQQLECTEGIISQLMMEIAQLKKENENLRIENAQSNVKIDEWKSNCNYLIDIVEKLQADNQSLHNNNEDPSMLEEYENGDVEVDYEAYAKEFSNMSTKKFY